MRAVRLTALLLASLCLQAQVQRPGIGPVQRIEHVELIGGNKHELSRGLRADLEGLTGEAVEWRNLEKLAARIKRELQARVVTPKLRSGSRSDLVTVLFEIRGRDPADRFNLSVPKGIYHSRQGWTGILEARLESRDDALSVGVVSDGDERTARDTGVRIGYQRKSIGSDKVGAGLRFACYRHGWHAKSLEAAQLLGYEPGVHGSRLELTPELVIASAQSWRVRTGLSLVKLKNQVPVLTQAATGRNENVRVVWGGWSYTRVVEEDEDEGADRFQADYEFRLGWHALGSDYSYARHRAEAEYQLRTTEQQLRFRLGGGAAGGRLPLFERMVAGNAQILRGWDKFTLAPLGGTRLGYGSLDYSIGWWRIFYDAGAVWDKGEPKRVRHSVGLGLGQHDSFFLELAFPLSRGKIRPAFITGLAF